MSDHEKESLGGSRDHGCQMVCFQTKNPIFGKILVSVIENVVIFCDLLEYFTAIRYNLQPFGIVCGHLVYSFPFWYVRTKKNLATLLEILLPVGFSQQVLLHSR
jgi:ABC-type spermidine/putrescine transport system permease subunit II